MISAPHILVLRFSALGDVAMTVPVIKNLLQQNPSLEISIVSTAFVKPLFDDVPRLHFYGIDLQEYKGVMGMYRLSQIIKKEIHFDAVADLHDVLRTKLLRFFLGGKKIAVIDKGRKEKKELTRVHNKILRPLKTGFQRYADVFIRLGFPVILDYPGGYKKVTADKSLLPFREDNVLLVGLAAFAKHNAKMYPLQKMTEVMNLLLKDKRIRILLFGTREESNLLTEWIAEKEDSACLMAGRLDFAQELNVISQLDVMLSMDSANMHLASLYGVPVVSVWGGTHPYLGFCGWGQNDNQIIQTDLPCRPSSVFGDKDCPVHGPAGCMQHISPEIIAQKIFSVIAQTRPGQAG